MYKRNMVRATKTDKQTVTPAAAPAAAAPLQNVVVEQSTAAPKKAKKTKTVVEAAPTSTPEPVVTAVTATPTEVTEVTESPISVKLNEFNAKLQQLHSIFSTVKSEFKGLEKSIQRELKAAQKSSSKKAKRSGNRQPSGFVKPTKISDELAQFLGKDIGVEMARTAVSKEINAYIRANSLQDAVNGRKIIPDAKLTKLLNISSGDELTYFNLQRYMKHHFVKTAATATA